MKKRLKSWKVQKAMLITTDTPPSRCTCGYLFEAVTGLGVPKPGDLSVCVNCCRFIQLDDQMLARPMTEEQIFGLLPEERAQLEHIKRQIQIFRNLS